MKIHTDSLHKIAYATDASVYREIPVGVAFPETEEDVRQLLKEAERRQTHVIPRAAGTSIAGQVVGRGIVADISKHFDRIVDIDKERKTATVQPGVVRDELNVALKPLGLFFSPETSTSSRCCIGGMVGNNSCGTHSLVYGSTRHHLIAAKGIMADGTTETFEEYTVGQLQQRFGEGFWKKSRHDTLIESVYAQLINWALDPDTVALIEKNYPDKALQRRSCGYAIDEVIEDLHNAAKDLNDRSVNLCKLICGSEGTLCFLTELTVSLDPLPKPCQMAVCAHCDTLDKSFLANLVALKHRPTAIELMDKPILDLSKGNREQEQNRFFVSGDPAAIIIAELRADTPEELERMAESLEKDLMGDERGLVYGCTRAYGADVAKVWALRKAGLGILGGMKGDAKPTGVVEDTAVAPKYLPAYMKDFQAMTQRLGAQCVYYGHISTGELHLRPIINLKTEEGRTLFREIAQQTALLVKKHRGSISGEHGDGRLRGEFIKMLYGDDTYELMRQVKRAWDPNGLFNLHKITDTLPMDDFLRFDVLQQYAVAQEKSVGSDKTYYNWKAAFDECTLPGATGAASQTQALMCTIEQCNGAGDCRKSNVIGGTMCPAFKVSRDELNTTRARANVVREILTRGYDSEAIAGHRSQVIGHGSQGTGLAPAAAGEAKLSPVTCDLCPESGESIFDLKELKEMLDSCLACKGCRRECPSNVDMTRIRAEILQHIYDQKGTPLRTMLVARMAEIEKAGRLVRPLYNAFARLKPTQALIKRIVNFAPQRSIPQLSPKTLRQLFREQGTGHRSQVTGHNLQVIGHRSQVTGEGATEKELSTANCQLSTVKGRVFLFADEFTDNHEAQLGIIFVNLLQKLGYEVVLPKHTESGRAAISKGKLKLAKKHAEQNVNALKDIVSADAPLVGIEPSCILSFRDEYPDLVSPQLRQAALSLADNCLLFDEFICQEIDKGNIRPQDFQDRPLEIWLHGHCHQKAIVGIEKTERMLTTLLNATVHTIPSGCCGMAGSFGYEKEHYETSMAIGEMVLFPAVRQAMAHRAQVTGHRSQGTGPAPAAAGEAKLSTVNCQLSPEVFVAAPGTSCRQQILDGTGEKALHPIEILFKMSK